MTLQESFNEFNENIRTSAKDYTISFRKDQIAKRINKDFRNGLDSNNYTLYVGSYGRNTDNVDVSDIDLLVILPWTYFTKYDAYQNNGQSCLLQAVKNSIASTYSQTKMRADGQVVQVTFSDLTFEIVPCFEYSDGSFCYADTNNGGTWCIMYPRDEIKAVQNHNKGTNYNMSALCRMMRSWKDTNNVNIKGITIDILAYRFLKNYQYRDKSYVYYDYIVRDFFKYLKDVPVTQSSYQVMGSNRYITDTGCFQNKAKQAYNLVLEAIEADSKGCNWTRNSKYREIFGNRFPHNR
jgi:hypothetical protein